MERVVLVEWHMVYQYFKELPESLLFITLLVLIAVDIITGKYKAIQVGILDSSIGTKGLIKHTTIIILTVIVMMGTRILNVVQVAYIFKMFYILEYVTSILENLDSLGIPFPDSFKKYFKRMRTENEQERIDDYDV